MQLFSDTSFFIWLAILLIPAFVLGYMEKPITKYGMAVSAFFILMSTRDIPISILYMIGFVLFEYLLISVQLFLGAKKGNSSFAYPLFLIISIAPLVLYKILIAAGQSGGILAFAGISYMTFKAVQIVIEISDGLISKIQLSDYLYLMLFFPTIIAGPIDRSRRFEKDIEQRIPRKEYVEMAGKGLYRIVLGMVYKLVIASVFSFVMHKYGMAHSATAAVIYYYTYGFYLFFDFAGYSLMAVGTGYMFGIRVPDNFNKPFISKDIQEFWDKWHITLSHWLRDYCFSRITMRIMKSGIIKNRLTTASVALLMNMLIMGCWHGLTANYIIYGLYHGILLALFEVIRKKSAFYKKRRKEEWFCTAEWLITLHLVLIGFLIFSGRFMDCAEYFVNHFIR